jgi:predicted CXXCH cytochrome family protein
MEDLYNKSPHKPVFATMGGGGCTVCHGNHEILKPSEAMLAGSGAVCANCHDAASEGGKTAAQMAALLAKLRSELDRADGSLTRARNSGMEVSEAQMRQIEGREALVKAQVAVHAFRLAEVEKPVKEGLAVAAEGVAAGEHALKERDTRRYGLMVFLVAALITMAGLWVAIRAIESRPEPAGRTAGSR